MNTLCEYAHPSLYDTSALERQGVGKMFPYHPAMYERTSDLYGPGSLLAWYLLISSFTLTSVFWPATIISSASDEQRRWRQPRVTADLLAISLYAIFAATDVLIQAVVTLRGLEDRATIILCLRFPNLKRRPDPLDDVDPSTLPQLPVEMPQDLLEYGQKIVSITGPLPVCYIALAVAAAWCYGWNEYRPARNAMSRIQSSGVAWEPSAGVVRLVAAMVGYVTVCLTVYHFSLGDVQTSGLLASLELLWPFWVGATCGAMVGVLVVVGIMGWAACSSIAWWRGGTASGSAQVRGQKSTDACMLLGFLFSAFGALWTLSCLIFVAYSMSDMTLLTDLAKSLTERGQLASLLVGVATTAYSAYDVFRSEGRRWRGRRALARGAGELTDLLSQAEMGEV
ncbi:hypothetical protein MN608_11375 [Microdochium nivale]|nr:hypothetical protein MN608_11375 [Microdochium nivale]